MSEETPTPESNNPQTPPPPAPEAAPPPATPENTSENTGPYTKEQKDKKLISGILGILVGTFGVHKFFLGYRPRKFFSVKVVSDFC